MVPASATLRVSAIWNLPGLLDELGVPTAQVLDESGLPSALFCSRENVLTYPQLECLLHVCARRTQCDHFGLLVGQRSRLADMGLAGEIASCATTAADALRVFVDHLNLHDTAATCTLHESNGFTRFVYSIVEHGLTETRHIQFGAVAMAHNVLQDLCGADFTPAEVSFATKAPASLRDFHRHFRAPVHFDQHDSSLLFDDRWLHRPLPSVAPARREAIEAAVADHRRQMLLDFPAVVRRLVRKQLLAGTFTMDDIAGLLSMHRRTLDRRLHDQGVHYGELVESVKEDVARHLLRETAMPIQEVAETVQFSSAANFATSFRRRVGMSPSAYRKG